jgi:alpha-N-acetylglucosamine transferase
MDKTTSTQTIKVGDYKLIANVDSDGHLVLTIDHADGSEVIDTEADNACSDTQWATRFTTQSIELGC